MTDTDIQRMALDYHRRPVPGKLSTQPTNSLGNQRDLALAYSPGVEAACNAITSDPSEAANLTAHQNLVAVISNKTAVLGLSSVGPILLRAARPAHM